MIFSWFAYRRAIEYEHHFLADELEREAVTAGFAVILHERQEVGMAVLAFQR